ncbi:MAG: potassium channel protein, partial [Desulfobacula sp.]|nr:potassium channel protein [Desulfobacula sp.]
GNFQVIMQMTAEMMVQAMQDKVHIPLQILLKNDANEEIYYVVVPEAAQDLTWWSLHDYLKVKYNYLTFAMQTSNKKVIVNPPKEQMVSKGDGIWLMAPKRPVNMAWPS